MKKLVVIVNGSGGSGKDTLIDYVSDRLPNGAVKYSTIDTVRSVASLIGWNGKKDEEGRLFLHRAKMMLAEWFDFSFKEMVDAIHAFLTTEHDVIFCQAREEEEIKRLCKYLDDKGIAHMTVLVTRACLSGTHYGNPADDNVGKDLEYNYWVENDDTKEDSGEFLLQAVNFERGAVSDNQGQVSC